MNSPPKCPILGCLLGTAVGDALALPTEGMSPSRVRHFSRDVLGHRLVFGRGMFSDDTEHTLMVAMSWMRHPDDTTAFQHSLGWSLRWWLLALPAGLGMSTLKAVMKLWLGFPPTRSGVRSAGNGAAMRSAIVGAVFAEDQERRRAFALASCRLTHVDPRAEESALLVAEAAALAARAADTETVIETLRDLVKSPEMRTRFEPFERSLQQRLSVPDYAVVIGCEKGVSGFAPNTVAMALYAWLRHRGDFKETIAQVITCGGDTDTVAAIAGGITGIEAGESGIPAMWVKDITDWPRSVTYIREVAQALSQRKAGEPSAIPRLCWPMVVPRNLVFLAIVLIHGFRRLLMPR